MNEIIYLDNNATTQLLPQAKMAMLNIMGTPLNASAIHKFGRHAKNIIEEARYNILKSLNFNRYDGYNLTFTASGTEANNLILTNFKHDNIIISTTEHQSINAVAEASTNFTYIKVDSNGIVDLNELEAELQAINGRKLVSIMLANNETGIIQPIKDIVALCRRFGAYIHSDLVQVIGKLDINIKELDLDFLTISGHKFGGPLGSAALIAKENIKLNPLIIGGGQEKNLRSGTENVVSIAGFAEACKFTLNMTKAMPAVAIQRNQIEQSLLAICPNAIIVGQSAMRLPNTSLIIMPNTKSQLQLISFDLAGIAVSSGAACSSGKVTNSHVLQAMNLPKAQAECAIRVSLSYNQAPSDITAFINTWRNIYYNSNQLINAV